ncbi:MAG TPA: YhfC family intramembrane metalloprotease [Lachnospiraceae bacterium]|nr:YhfC family intramembrane metalloprotease [Lachnospiraceae bacterium]
MLLVSLIVGIMICYALPTAGLFILMRKKKGAGKAFGWGVLAFVVSQLLIRVPILQLVLPNFQWFTVMQFYPWRYGLFLGLTAGLAEETVRWIAARCFLRGKDTLGHGLAFGLGHGGIEAMLVVGPNMIAGTVMVLTGQTGLFPADWASVLVGGAERIFAMAFHIGAALLVMYGVRAGRGFRYWLLAVALHTVMDAAVVILPAVFGVGVMGLELYAAALGGLTLALGIWFYRRG